MTEREQASVPRDQSLLRRLERTLAGIESSDTVGKTLRKVLESALREFGEELGLLGGRIYRRDGEEFTLRHHFGSPGTGSDEIRIPASYAAIRKLRAQGYVLMDRSSPEFDPQIESSLGVTHFAAIGVGENTSHIIAFSLRDDADEDLTLYALNALRHVLNLKVRQRHLESLLDQAREIQASLLPYEPPTFPGFDIAGRTHPSDVVGGDVFDFHPVSSRILGLLIADAAGYGFPAALQSRDIVVGMRMGVEDGLKMTRTLEKLNRVIHRTSLNSRFVSLFYAEIESNGNLIYINAGHNAPILLVKERAFRLQRGGMVLGPNPGALYERGFHVMDPGDVLLLFTDGITEATDAAENEFGEERLMDLLRRQRDEPAAAIMDSIFEEVGAFSDPGAHNDDRTLVVVRRVG